MSPPERQGAEPGDGVSLLDTVFEPLATATTFEETVERLGRAIRIGVLVAGERLPPERDLAAQLGISRSTLRDAITALTQSGVLVSRRGRRGGTFVAEGPPLTRGTPLPAPAEMRDLLDERLALETGCATLAAERIDAEGLAAMEATISAMENAQEFADYRRADMRFHLVLAEATASPRLVSAATRVQDQLGELLAALPHPRRVLSEATVQHRLVLEALARSDPDQAARLIRRHLRGTEAILAGLLPGEPPADGENGGGVGSEAAS